MKKLLILLAANVFSASVVSAHSNPVEWGEEALQDKQAREWEEDGESLMQIQAAGCSKATSSQLKEVNHGNSHKDDFLKSCASKTDNSPWCNQLVRPNPSSISTFRCTYGTKQVHQLVHPSSSTWKYAVGAVQLIKELERKNIKVCEIYNWWRPAPYNGNVGGAAGRHPFGTSVDVRFCSMKDMERAFTQLCEWRRQGRLRALGYYGSTGLHFGMGDQTANTWGKSCR